MNNAYWHVNLKVNSFNAAVLSSDQYTFEYLVPGSLSGCVIIPCVSEIIDLENSNFQMKGCNIIKPKQHLFHFA